MSELEYCIECDEPIGKAGHGEDSLCCDYCNEGPFCKACFDEHNYKCNMRFNALCAGFSGLRGMDR